MFAFMDSVRAELAAHPSYCARANQGCQKGPRTGLGGAGGVQTHRHALHQADVEADLVPLDDLRGTVSVSKRAHGSP